MPNDASFPSVGLPDRSIGAGFPHQYSRSHCLLHGCHRYQYRYEEGTARKGGGRRWWLRFTQMKGLRSGGVSPYGCAGTAVTDVDQRVSDEDQFADRAITPVLERLALA